MPRSGEIPCTRWVCTRTRARAPREVLLFAAPFGLSGRASQTPSWRMRRGVTLLEVVAVLAIVGIVMAIAAPSVATWKDKLAVERATGEVVSFYWQARTSALFRGTRVRLEFGVDSLQASFEGVTDSVFLTRPGPSRHGVSLRVSRPVIRVYPNGFGLGAANTKLVLWRGAAAESLTTSRLGRLKRWN